MAEPLPMQIDFNCAACGCTELVLSNGQADDSVVCCKQCGRRFGLWSDIEARSRNPNDHELAHLKHLTPDRFVVGTAAARVRAPELGVVLKFAMPDGTTESFYLNEPGYRELMKGLTFALQLGALPAISDEEHRRLLQLVPKIASYDANLHHQTSRVAVDVDGWTSDDGSGWSFKMQNGAERKYWLQRPLDRFFAQWLAQFQ